MPKINVGTTTYVNAGRYGWQRKIIKTSDGNLFLFAITGTGSTSTRLRYKKSTDNWATWDSTWTAVYTAADVNWFDIYNDSDNLYFIFASSVIKFLKLTYSAGSYSAGSAVTAHSANYTPLNITKRTDGNYWIADYSGSTIFTYYSSDDGATWNSGGTIATGATVYGGRIIPYGSNLWILYQTGTALKYAEYISSWGTPVVITSTLTVQVANHFTANKVSDTDIWIAATKYNATAANRTIKIWHYTGSWDGGTEISNSGTNEDIEPNISIVGDIPLVIWNENAKANINYRKWNGSGWDSIVTLDSTNVFEPCVCEEDVNYLYTYWLSGSGSPYTIYFEAVNLNPTQTKDLTSDAHIKAVGLTSDLTSDAEITNKQNKDLTSDAVIKIVGETEDLTSDANIILDRVEKDLTSDANISAQAIKDLTSDAYLVTSYFSNINNKVTFVKGIREDIINTVAFVKRVLGDLFNVVSFVKRTISDIDNDVRTQKRKLYDLSNDVRFYKSWQKVGTLGYHSLGRTYIKVYINEIDDTWGNYVEQTDVDVDSIRIGKEKNQPQTASFDLGRAYDATKPDQEAKVIIKYNEWRLYKGYIVSISPSEKPETITINCQDKAWIDNRTNKYFRVGHKPTDDKELYYSTIKTAISTAFSWVVDLGNFVPQVIDCFAIGTSDALTNLITEAGNYGWFYDENWVRQLWTAGKGSIVNIQRQILGTNVELYQLLDHRFDEDVTSVVNKFRVQMGEKVVRNFNNTGGGRQYSSYRYSNFQGFLIPDWDDGYELLSYETGDGYGFDNPDPEDAAEYAKVYRQYQIPYLNREISSWSDRYQPYIEVYERYSGSWVSYGYPTSNRITDGFTIDYENRLLIFSEPQFLYRFDRNGRLMATQAPILKLYLFKKDYYTSTATSSDEPESDIGNPLMFFTDKMGDYPTTIIDDLNLSDLTIQIGGDSYDASGVKIVVPSWDDTAFARDKANWELSKVCDKKIKGTIELTLDAVCFYGIDLSNRIFIDGITESPMSVLSLVYDINSFKVTIELENSRYFRRSVSLPSRGE